MFTVPRSHCSFEGENGDSLPSPQLAFVQSRLHEPLPDGPTAMSLGSHGSAVPFSLSPQNSNLHALSSGCDLEWVEGAEFGAGRVLHRGARRRDDVPQFLDLG